MDMVLDKWSIRVDVQIEIANGAPLMGQRRFLLRRQ